MQIEDMTDVSPRARLRSLRAMFGRQRRIIVSVIGTLIAIGAFLAWGPIGPGPIGDGTESDSTSGQPLTLDRGITTADR